MRVSSTDKRDYLPSCANHHDNTVRDGEHNERQVAPISQWHTTHGSKSNVGAGYVAHSNIPGSPSLVTHGPSKSARSPLRDDYSPKNSFQGACNRPPVMRGGYRTSASMVVPACESLWGATDDASDVRVVPNSVPQGRSTCSERSLKVPVSGKLQINKES
jgi:hypothetical protein